MSRRRALFRYGVAVPLILAAASCAVVPEAAPPPAPAPVAAPAPAPTPAPPPAKTWDDRDLDAGDWRYDSATQSARFVQPGNGTALLTFRCNMADHKVEMMAGLGDGTQSLDAQLRTTDGNDMLRFVKGRAILDSQDLRLDRIAFSRGRFALDASNGSHLTLPVYAEIERVIEDCRG